MDYLKDDFEKFPTTFPEYYSVDSFQVRENHFIIASKGHTNLNLVFTGDQTLEFVYSRMVLSLYYCDSTIQP